MYKPIAVMSAEVACGGNASGTCLNAPKPLTRYLQKLENGAMSKFKNTNRCDNWRIVFWRCGSSWKKEANSTTMKLKPEFRRNEKSK